MTRLSRLLLPALCLLLLSACGRAPEPYQERLMVFGTLVEITLHEVDEAKAQQAMQAVERQLRAQHAAWHAWEDSELTALNARLARGEAVTLSDDLRLLVTEAKRLAAASDHHFNPAIGQLIALWGFHGDDTAREPPAPEAVAALVEQAPRMSDLQLTQDLLISHNPALQLDFGGFAKGLALDRALATLRRHGVEHALINMGGDLRVIGRPGDRHWRIGIRNPRGEGLLASLEIDNGESVFTSGDYERYFEHAGARYHHIIDGRSGQPARGLAAVTVVHDSAAVADAATTALLVAGPEHWQAIAGRLGLREVMVIDEAGHVTLTPALAERLRFELEPPAVNLSPPL